MKIQNLSAEKKIEYPLSERVVVSLEGTVPSNPSQNKENTDFRDIREKKSLVSLTGAIDIINKQLFVNLEGEMASDLTAEDTKLNDDFAVTLKGKVRSIGGDRVMVTLNGQIDSEIEPEEANQESLGQHGLVLPKLKELPPYGRIKEWREEGFGINNSDSRRLVNGHIGPNSWDD